MRSNKLSFFIVEDEIEAVNALIEALRKKNRVEVIGNADNVDDAYIGILKTKPDALLLDIKLRGGNAFHLLERFQRNNVECPPVIFMTGHDEFELAQKAVNEHRDKILKILKKPFWEKFDTYFSECLDAVFAYYQANLKNEEAEVLFVKESNITYRIEYDDIDYIEVGGGGTIFLVTSDKVEESKKVNETLNSFLSSMPDRFVRIHRNHAVHMGKVEKVDHNDHLLYLKGHEKGFDIGRTYYSDLIAYLGDKG